MKKRMRGFTLLELMLVIIIAAVLFGIGVPSFRNVVRDSRLTSAANDVVVALHAARSEAVKRRAVTIVCSSGAPLAGTPACSAGAGWIAWADLDADLTVDADEPVLIQHDLLPQGITPAARDRDVADLADGWYVAFADNGLAVTIPSGGTLGAMRSLVLCDSRGNVVASANLSAARLVSVSAIGRPAVSRDADEISGAGGCGS